MGTVLALVVLGLAGFGVWKWAVARGSAATLDWIDARFPRDGGIKLAAEGRYGADPAQKVELWVPTGKALAQPARQPGHTTPPITRPLVVFVHGGGWHSGAPEEYRFVARTLGEKGYATALVGYRLVPSGRFPAMLEDTANAIRWVRDRAGKNAVRSDKMILAGHSAGAYNVLMMGLDPQWLDGAGVPMASVAGIVSLAGPADFYPFTSDSGRNALGHVADPLTTQPIAFARAGAPPILLLHGTADTVVRVRNSRNLAAAIRAKGGPVQEIEFEGMGHAGIVMGLSKPFAQDGKVLDPLLAFIREPRAGGQGAPPAPSVPVQREDR